MAILLTVGLGAGALFAFAGFINGIVIDFREKTIHSHYGYGQIHTKGYRDKVFEDPVKHWIGDWPALSLFFTEVKEVTDVFPRVTFSALLKKGNIAIGARGEGVEGEKEAKFFTALNIVEGEALSGLPRGILLGKGIANALNAHPGDTVTILAKSTKNRLSEEAYNVIGVFHTGNDQFDKSTFRVELKDAQDLLSTTKLETISLGLRELSDWEPIANKIEEKFPDLEATPFDELDKIYYKNSIDWLNAQFSVVLCIILGIVILGIFNSISASILERKQEIGNLRANGESVLQIMRLIIAEGALLSLIGSILGIAFTYTVLMLFVHNQVLMPPGPGQTSQSLLSFTFDIPMGLKTTAYIAIAALLASFLAGIKVAKMPIAKALRSN